MNLEGKLTDYRNIIIDTSAFMAFFYKEKGWEIVAQYMPKAIMSAVNLSEAIKIFMEYEGLSKNESLEFAYKVLEKVLDFDQEQAAIAGELSLVGREYGLSLGDRACIAAGLKTGFPVITADRVWKEAGFEGIEIIVIR